MEYGDLEDLVSEDVNNALRIDASGKLFVSMSGGAQIQTDFDQDDNTKEDYIKNRPRINGSILKGNRVLPEDPLTNFEIEAIFGA